MILSDINSYVNQYAAQLEIIIRNGKYSQYGREGNFVKFFAYTNNQLGKNKSNDIALLMKE